MIRRNCGADYLLIKQHDHALLAGRLARHIGNAIYSPPSPRDAVIEAISLHDSGWPPHDDLPTLNPAGKPLHVFESPAELALECWSRSAEVASAAGPYQGLLVSLQVLGLSAHALTNLKTPTRFETFEFNKFHHRLIEIQEELRTKLGLGNESPRHLGLTTEHTSAADDLLRFNYRLLTLMDRISLALCCGTHLFPVMDDVHPAPGNRVKRIKATMPDPATMILDPWPFDAPVIELNIPARRISRAPFKTVEDFRSAYQQAAEEPLILRVRQIGRL